MIRRLYASFDRLVARFHLRVRLTILGIISVLLVLVLDMLGAVEPVERLLYDARARTCQFGRPATMPFVHVDIDDASLEAVGKWPWPRRLLAASIDELKAAEAKLIGLDLLFPERDRHDDWVAAMDATREKVATTPTTRTSLDLQLEVDVDDRSLVKSVGQSDVKVFLPVTFSWKPGFPEEEIVKEIKSMLKANPKLDQQKLKVQLLSNVQNSEKEACGRDIDRVFRDSLVKIRQDAFLDVMLKSPRRSKADQRGVFFEKVPTTGPAIVDPMERFFDRQFEKSEAIWALWEKFRLRSDINLLSSASEDVPFEALAKQAGGFGFVNYINDDDGIVRSVPLLMNEREHIVPQFGLALACAELNVHPDVPGELTVHEDRIILHPNSGEYVTIPVFTAVQRSGQASVPASFLLPWSGGRDWEIMFGPRNSTTAIRHLPFTAVSKILELRFRLEENRRNSLDDLNALRMLAGSPTMGQILEVSRNHEDAIDETLKSRSLAFKVNSMRNQKEDGFKNSTKEEADFFETSLKRNEVLKAIKTQNREIIQKLDAARDELRSAVRGKVVIVGWAATGAAADFVPTPIHDKCPGAVIHGLVYNAILTQAGMRMGGSGINIIVIILLGLAATWVMVQAAPREEPNVRPLASSRLAKSWQAIQFKLSPIQGTALGVSVIILWIVFNSVLLFGWRHYVLNLSSPLIAVLLVWSLGIAAIAAERFRIGRLLHGYVDPKLVEFLKKHPERELFLTRQMEVTVCFSDIEGFTYLTQRLGEKMIPLLQDYLGRMVKVIRSHNGVVNKFMGDGIMYIFGVPQSEGNHAEAALRCCLEMQEALAKFNDEKALSGLPQLTMRCGVNTGTAFVGDAGPSDAREYTALGDTTNLAARLEPANKEFGTRILVSEATRGKVAGDTFFFRPIGRLKLRNRDGCVETFELVGSGSSASPREQQRARMLEGMVRAFQSELFDQCVTFAERICKEFGESLLCDLYRRQCEKLKQEGVKGFEGQVSGE